MKPSFYEINSLETWVELEARRRIDDLTPGVELRIEEWFMGRYQIERYLGVGGTSLALLGTDTLLDRKVVLKVRHGRSTGLPSVMLLNEAKILAKIKHPNIVEVFDYGDNSIVWLALEYLGADTLQSVLHEMNAHSELISIEEVLSIAAQIADLLEYLHNSARVHQIDLKPANLAYNNLTHTIKMMDLGSVNGLEHLSHIRYGTPGYLAPELFSSFSGFSTTPLSDIFSFGVVLFEILTGFCPLIDIQTSLAKDNFKDFFRRPVSISFSFEEAERERESGKKKAEEILEKMRKIDYASHLMTSRIPSDLRQLLLSMLSFEASDRPLAHLVRLEISKIIANGKTIKKPSVFISHSSKDKERFVENLATGLKNRGFEIWIDKESLLVGEPFWDVIGDAIQKSDFVLIVLSKNSINSNGVSEELRIAQLLNLGTKVKIVPIRIDSIDFNQIPINLRARHILDFAGWKSKDRFDEYLSKLATDMHLLYRKNLP